MSREYTTRFLELLDEGMFNKDLLIQDLLGYLSEQEVKDFVKREDFFGFEDLETDYQSHLEDQAQEEYYMRQFD